MHYVLTFLLAYVFPNLEFFSVPSLSQLKVHSYGFENLPISLQYIEDFTLRYLLLSEI